MFSISFLEAIQQFDPPGWSLLMRFISSLGMVPFLLTIIYAVCFGFDFRRGVVMLNILAWTALFTNLLKAEFDYPRPPDLSENISNHIPAKNDWKESPAELGFFQWIPHKILAETRNDDWDRQGFPSGHTSTQTALWLSFIILFRKPWVYWTGGSIIVLTMLSRMYLGMHFLADVLAGLVLGVFISLLFLRYIKDTRFYTKRTQNFKTLKFLGFPLLLIPFIGFFNPHFVGSLIGINAAVLLQLQLKNVPINNGYAKERILMALLGVFITLFAFYIPAILGIPKIGILNLLLSIIFSFLGFYGSLELGRKLNLIRT